MIINKFHVYFEHVEVLILTTQDAHNLDKRLISLAIFSIMTHIWGKCYFFLIQILINRSLHIFAHGTAAVLLWHVQKIVVIS